jgi:hypothetical protein
VISTAFAVLLRNIVPFCAVALIVGIPYILVSGWSAGEDVPGNPSANLGPKAIKVLISLLTMSLTTSALTYGTFQDLRGQRAGFGDILARGLASTGKVVVAAIGYSILVGLASLLLLIPGVIVVVVLWVFIPALVVERCSIGESFSRSAALTKGKRWQVFAIILIALVIQVLFGATVGFVIGFAVALSGMVSALPWLIAMIELLAGAFAAVMATVGYYYLRAEKEGIVIDDLARVFD